jgi:hypothetical protein
MQLDDTLVCIDIDLPGLRDRIADEGRFGCCLKQRRRTWVAESAAGCRRLQEASVALETLPPLPEEKQPV